MKSRQTKSSKKGSRQLPLYVYLAYLLVCTFLLTGVSFSRYISSANGSDSARVAEGIVVVTHDANTTIEMDRPGGTNSTTSEEFKFRVSNSVSEVDIQYDVVVKLDEALPAGVTMTVDGNPCSGNSNNTYTFSSMGTFAAGEEKTNTHTLSFMGNYDVIWEQSERDITISVQAEQID